MKVLSFLVTIALFGIGSVASAGMFSKAKSAADAEGNCLAEVITQNARLYSELEALDKVAARSEAQAKSAAKESQKLSLVGFKELGVKAKSTRASIKKFNDTYGASTCKAMVRAKSSTWVVKESAASLDKVAEGYEKMAEDYLKPIAVK